MLLGFIFTGFILIVVGLLVKQYPNLLAGYNTLSEEQKKEIDIEKVSTIARNVIVLTGAAVIDASIIMYFIEVSKKIQVNIISVIIVLGLVVLIIWSNRVPKLK
ncbi:MAG: DUF3784 domain-containing protein [Flavobacteriaceae bacterium]|nr:DUF3784 domain-containing protein [Flavobacteriaceae bacterium]